MSDGPRRKRTFRVKDAGASYRVTGRTADPVLSEAGIATPPKSTDRPVIGITTATGEVGSPTGSLVSGDAAMTQFAEVIQDLGGVPVLLPPVVAAEAVRRHVELVDGLVLSGGADVHPNLAGGGSAGAATPPAAPAHRYDPRKDRYEWLLLERALEFDTPILGVGRGFHLMNLVLGGTLVEDENAPEAAVSPHKGARVRMAHRLDVVPGTMFADIAGVKTLQVKGSQGQRIGVLAEGATAGAHREDGTVEAAEVDDAAFALGVQFSPERMIEEGSVGHRLFEALLRAAAEIGPAEGPPEAV